MKIKEKDSDSVDKSVKLVKKNGTVNKTKKNKNFEVRIPRVIVRNLSFKVKEEQLKKAFEQRGASVKNVTVVIKDGQSKGFAFITFDKLEDAQDAIEKANGQKLLGRPMAVDWSLPKNIYEKMQKKESSSPIENNSYGIQSNSSKTEIEQRQDDEEEKHNLTDNDDDDDIEQQNSDEENSKPVKTTTESSLDIREHRTLFIRNIPFDATEKELKELLSSNGQRRILKCRLVIDPVSRHPRGSAFIQFASEDDAQQCLNLPFTLHGQNLQVDMALGRGELARAKELRDNKNDKKIKNDQRNLALANYGVILDINQLDGNESDLRKRQQLEDAKKRKLQSPFFFVSPTRLTIHNLPRNVDDNKLRNVILETLKSHQISTKNSVNECRVMKNNKDSKKSLGFGFISVSDHNVALRIIDYVNNNKHIFGPNRRPIIQFSIEDSRALRLKEQRLERLRAKQELLKNSTNKTLAFESNKKKKQKCYLSEKTKDQIRLSEILKQGTNGNDESQSTMEVDQSEKPFKYNSNTETKMKKKRLKKKSKPEIRDKLDEMVLKSRNKLPLPNRTKKKWFE